MPVISWKSFKERVQRREPVLGPFMKVGEPALIECLGFAGFDFAIIDSEHGPITMETAQQMVRAAWCGGIAPIVRVMDNQPGLIQKVLDMGAAGVQIPQVNDREGAERAVRAARFAPAGERGLCCYTRAARYSARPKDEYVREANRETMVIIQVEGVRGIDNIDAILEVPGIDILFLGPYDLSQSLGVPGEVESQVVIDKMNEVIEKSAERGVVVGTFVDSPEAANRWISRGVCYISLKSDMSLFMEGCRLFLSGVQKGR